MDDGGGGWRGVGSTGRRGLRPSPPSFPAANLTTLVLVACHSVYTGLDYRSDDVSSWYLLDYQRGVQGQGESFLEHIRLGIDAAADEPSALLMFSGGKTRRGAGPRAEGEGYWLVAEAHDWYGKPQVKARAYTEVGKGGKGEGEGGGGFDGTEGACRSAPHAACGAASWASRGRCRSGGRRACLFALPPSPTTSNSPSSSPNPNVIPGKSPRQL